MRYFLLVTLLAFTLTLLTTDASVAGNNLQVGVFVPSQNMQALDTFEAAVGRKQDIVLFFQAWAYGNGQEVKFDRQRAQSIVDRGSIPMVGWEPWRWGGGVEQPLYSLKNISSGRHDTYIRQYARDVKTVDGVVYIRLMHEMNSNWYPWAGWSNGNNPADYVPAWRHTVDLFRREGVTNVRWVWAPNNVGLPNWNASSFKQFWPGESYVDFAGVDGYNFGRSDSWSSWASFSKIFDAAYKEIVGLTNKPIIIAETASVEAGGDKAQWINQMFTALAGGYPRVVALIWFNERGPQQDWRVESSSASLAAYRQGLKNLSAARAVDITVPVTGISAPAYSTSQSKRPNFKVAWSGTNLSSAADIAFYQVQRKVGSQGSWKNWQASTTAKSAVFNGVPGRTYYFRARATDAAGVRGSWSPVKNTVVPHDNETLLMKERRGFGRVINNGSSSYYQGTVRYATKRGASVTYRFTGRSVAIIGTKAPKRGLAKIYIDGKYVKTVNAYANTARYRRVLYSRDWKTSGTHTLRVVNEGTLDRPRFDLDGIAVRR
jgi:hypothetical protein